MAALFLSKTYPEKQITWLYPEDNNTIGVGEGMVPEVSSFLRFLGIDHKDVIKRCNGSLKLGIKFEGFNREGETFIFPFGVGEQNPKHNTASITRIIETGKIPKDIFDYPDISCHIRASEILAYLDTILHEFPNLTIDRRSVTKEDLEGTYDLLIDSTGFKRMISKQPDNLVSLSDRLANNRALAFRHPYTDRESQCLPYSTFTAKDYGWIWHIPLGDQLAMGYVHDGKFADEALAQFVEHIEKKMGIAVDTSTIKEINMVTGRNKVHLKDNVVAIGLASGFIEPLESTGLYLTIAGIKRLAEYIDGKITEDEYNDAINKDFDTVTDFIIAHYKYSKRENEYWNFYKTVPNVLHKEMEIFPAEAWNFILAGFDKNFDPPAAPLDPQEMINIHKGTPYHQWLDNERNAT